MNEKEIISDAIYLIKSFIEDAAFLSRLEVEQWIEEDETRGPIIKKIFDYAKRHEIK